MSEFGISKEEILFRYTLPQLQLFAKARIERNELSERDRKKGEISLPKPPLPTGTI